MIIRLNDTHYQSVVKVSTSNQEGTFSALESAAQKIARDLVEGVAERFKRKGKTTKISRGPLTCEFTGLSQDSMFGDFRTAVAATGDFKVINVKETKVLEEVVFDSGVCADTLLGIYLKAYVDRYLLSKQKQSAAVYAASKEVDRIIDGMKDLPLSSASKVVRAVAKVGSQLFVTSALLKSAESETNLNFASLFPFNVDDLPDMALIDLDGYDTYTVDDNLFASILERPGIAFALDNFARAVEINNNSVRFGDVAKKVILRKACFNDEVVKRIPLNMRDAVMDWYGMDTDEVSALAALLDPCGGR